MRDLVWKLLLSLSFVYLTTRVPSLMGNPGTFDAWLHTLYFGMSLPGSIVRSAKSVGAVAGGMTGGGPGGAGVAALAGTGVAAGAISAVRSMADVSTPSYASGDGAAPRSAGE